MDASHRDGAPKRGDALRIGVVSPPMLPIPPARYAGTERIVAALVDGLHRRGHQVTLFAPGRLPGRLRPRADGPAQPLVDRISRRPRGVPERHAGQGLVDVDGDFDVIHSHLDTMGLPFARWCPTPVVSTLHGRLDGMGHPALLDEFCDVPLVAISESQRRWSPQANWVATIHHGLDLARCAVQRHHGELSRLRRSHRAGEGRRRRDRSCAKRPACVCASAAKVYDQRERDLFDRGRRAGDRRGRRRVPGRGRTQRARRAIRRGPGHGDAWSVAGAVRPRGDRIDGDGNAGHRAPRRAPCPRSSSTAVPAFSSTTCRKRSWPWNERARSIAGSCGRSALERFSRRADARRVRGGLPRPCARPASPTPSKSNRSRIVDGDRRSSRSREQGEPEPGKRRGRGDRPARGRRWRRADRGIDAIRRNRLANAVEPGVRHGTRRRRAPAVPVEWRRSASASPRLPHLPGRPWSTASPGSTRATASRVSRARPTPWRPTCSSTASGRRRRPSGCELIEQRYDFATGELRTHVDVPRRGDDRDGRDARRSVPRTVPTIVAALRSPFGSTGPPTSRSPLASIRPACPASRTSMPSRRTRGRTRASTDACAGTPAATSRRWASPTRPRSHGDAAAERRRHTRRRAGLVLDDLPAPGTNRPHATALSLLTARRPGPVPCPAGRAGGPAGRRRREARASIALRRENRARLDGAVARPDRDRRRRSPLAGDHRRQRLLPPELDPRGVAGEHLAVRPRLLAELPLLPRPRDVGHRDVHGAAAPAPGPGRGACPARLPVPAPDGGPPQRRDARLARRDVPVGELPATRRGVDAGRPPVHRGPRQRGRRARVRRLRPCDRRRRLRATDRLARPPVGRRVDRRRGSSVPIAATRSAARSGPREHYEPVDNNAYTNMSAAHGARERPRLRATDRRDGPAAWRDIADGLVLPRDRRRGAIINHDGARLDEAQGGVPGGCRRPVPGRLPRRSRATELATYRYAAVEQAPLYVGAPMLSALLPVYAARAGEPRVWPRELLERGYGDFINEPFLEPDEYPALADGPAPRIADVRQPERLPDGAPVRLHRAPARARRIPTTWAVHPVRMPEGWRGIHVERVWVRGQAHALEARSGADRRIARAVRVGPVSCVRRGQAAETARSPPERAVPGVIGPGAGLRWRSISVRAVVHRSIRFTRHAGARWAATRSSPGLTPPGMVSSSRSGSLPMYAPGSRGFGHHAAFRDLDGVYRELLGQRLGRVLLAGFEFLRRVAELRCPSARGRSRASRRPSPSACASG